MAYLLTRLTKDIVPTHTFAGDYTSITDGLPLVATIIVWSTILNFLAFKSKRIENIIKPSRLLLVENGQFVRRNMRREFITERELMSEIRAKGISGVKQVKEASIESDGSISIVKR